MVCYTPYESFNVAKIPADHFFRHFTRMSVVYRSNSEGMYICRFCLWSNGHRADFPMGCWKSS